MKWRDDKFMDLKYFIFDRIIYEFRELGIEKDITVKELSDCIDKFVEEVLFEKK